MKNKHANMLGLGTAAIGRPHYINIRQEQILEFSLDAFREKGRMLLEEAYRKGIRYFDTAPGYGMAEQLLIDWVTDKNDSSIEVASKWGYTYVANFDSNATQHEVKEHSLEKLNEQWKKSKVLLPNLRIYQIHSATFETGVIENERILNRLAELKSEYNLIIGITTTGANQKEVLTKAIDIEVDSESLFDLFQVTYNIFDQSLATVAEEIAKRNKRLVIKEAMANGRVFPNKNYPQYHKAYNKLNELKEKYNVGIDAIALRFCMDSIPVFKVLSGAANEQHLLDNLKIKDFRLEEEDIMQLKEQVILPECYWDERKQLNWN
jgi:aryl-alcohol dehydrogenase-like predicted oxidoreductase